MNVPTRYSEADRGVFTSIEIRIILFRDSWFSMYLRLSLSEIIVYFQLSNNGLCYELRLKWLCNVFKQDFDDGNNNAVYLVKHIIFYVNKKQVKQMSLELAAICTI